jgi:phosphoglycerol transferase
MAGMVATQCGVPLAVDVSSDFAAPDNTRVFMPSAVCLGDLLVQQGFRNVFMGGAHLTFAGKGTFLRDHGYSERYGRTEWENAGAAKSEFNEVGMYDSALFDRARIMLSQLHAGKAPYNLTLLTLDTHSPGFYSERCRAVSGQRIERVVACSTSVVSEFVRFARDQGYLDNTLVVIIGDHLAHPNEAQAKLEQIPERRIFNLLLSPSPVELSKRAIVHYDWFPTLAQALGLEVAGGRLGLGYSAIEAASPPPTDIRQRIKSIPTAGSAAYSALWSAP